MAFNFKEIKELGEFNRCHSSPTSTEVYSVARTADTFGSLSGTSKWHGGVLAPNGKIYGIPCNSASVLEIETDDEINNFADGTLQGNFLNKY